jgi:hypothetical protein
LFFEQVIRENLDLGRPEEIKLIFNRRLPRGMRTPFRTRIVTRDVTPSLNVYCAIRGKAATASDGKRPVVPRQGGHPIRAKAATDSDRRRPPVDRLRRGALSAI